MWAFVTAIPMTASGRPGSQSDISGDRLDVTDLLPSTYRFVAQQAPIGGAPVAAAVHIVEVGNGDLEGIDLDLQPTVDLHGSVSFASGCPPAPLWMRISSDLTYYNVHPDSSGSFVVPRVIQGHYNAHVILEVPSTAVPSSVKFGRTGALRDGFDLTAKSAGPLRITMGCPGR
jgi:hypothetical protein